MTGAIERRSREGRLAPAQRQQLLDRLELLSQAWDEVDDLRSARSLSLRLLARYRLRAADSLQLASAVPLAEDDPSSIDFVCLDRNLADAAGREGFRLKENPPRLNFHYP